MGIQGKFSFTSGVITVNCIHPSRNKLYIPKSVCFSLCVIHCQAPYFFTHLATVCWPFCISAHTMTPFLSRLWSSFWSGWVIIVVTPVQLKIQVPADFSQYNCCFGQHAFRYFAKRCENIYRIKTQAWHTFNFEYIYCCNALSKVWARLSSHAAGSILRTLAKTFDTLWHSPLW